MTYDIASRDRPETDRERSREDHAALADAVPSREREIVRLRGYRYCLSPAEAGTLHDIGRFRTVAIADLARHRYEGKTALLQRDLYVLREQGLLQIRTAWTGGQKRKLPVVVLTRLGKALLEKEHPVATDQRVYAGFVKPSEVRHDAAIYRMYHAERERIERSGGRVRRVVLDYELKQKVYSPLAKAKVLPPLEYAKRQMEVARQNGLTVIQGKIPLPDLRIEYETAAGEPARVDLELTTGHYHGPALQEKAAAGFKMYAADGSGSRLSRVLEEREITAEILSL
jgi:hypothetical protein